MCVCAHVYVCVCVCECVQLCVHECCMCVCVCVCVCVWKWWYRWRHALTWVQFTLHDCVHVSTCPRVVMYVAYMQRCMHVCYMYYQYLTYHEPAFKILLREVLSKYSFIPWEVEEGYVAKKDKLKEMHKNMGQKL